jgi:murein DD-endopeptidase MepM/ murein hydrolase activator NlpD
MHQRVVIERQLERLRDNVRERIRHLRGEIAIAEEALRVARHVAAEPATWRTLHRLGMRFERQGLRALARWERKAARRHGALVRRKRRIAAWLSAYGAFEVCPVPGYSSIADNYGVIVDLRGVPRHVHRGSDIVAPAGAAIRAPFDGVAFASTSTLGGYQVTVEGPRGSAFNAHLSRYGRLGSVRAGDVIGYVGATGDASVPHDHFEWHPGGGAAVDPYGLLVASCVELPGPR